MSNRKVLDSNDIKRQAKKSTMDSIGTTGSFIAKNSDDTSTGRLALGKSTIPVEPHLHVAKSGGLASLPLFDVSDVLTIEAKAGEHGRIAVITDDDKRAGFVMGDKSGAIRGAIFYDNSDETLQLASSNVVRLVIDSNALRLKNMKGLLLPELASDMPIPAVGLLAVYAKTDHKAYKRDSTGSVTELGTGGGGGVAEEDANNVLRYNSFY